MATYTVLDKETVTELFAHYDLGHPQDFAPMPGGNANSSMIVDTGGQKYVLSVCDEKNVEEIATLTTTLELLNRKGFPTSTLIKTTDGRAFIEYQNKPVYIKKYIAGSVVKDLTPNLVSQIGNALARLHAVPAADFLSDSFAYGKEDFKQISANEGEFAKWLEEKTIQLGTCCPADLPRGLIHGDLFYDNILFSGNQLSAILDFEEACNYFFIFDLGMCAAGCCTTQSVFSLELARALVQGYEEQRMLEPIEREVFQCHIGYGAIATSFWRYRQFNILIPTQDKKESYREMTKLADDVLNIPRDRFYRTVFK